MPGGGLHAPFSCCFPVAIPALRWQHPGKDPLPQDAPGCKRENGPEATVFPGAGRASRQGTPPGCRGAGGWGHQTCGAGKVTLRVSPPQPEWRRRSAGPWRFPGRIPPSACSPGAGRLGWLPSRGHQRWTRHKLGLVGAALRAASAAPVHEFDSEESLHPALR